MDGKESPFEISFDILKQMEDLFQMVGIEFPFDEYTKFFRKYKNI